MAFTVGKNTVKAMLELARSSHLRWLDLAKRVLALRVSQSNGFQACVSYPLKFNVFLLTGQRTSRCASENRLNSKRTKESKNDFIDRLTAQRNNPLGCFYYFLSAKLLLLNSDNNARTNGSSTLTDKMCIRDRDRSIRHPASKTSCTT